MIMEQSRRYEKSSILSVPMTSATVWGSLSTSTAGAGGGTIASPAGSSWGQVLKYRERLYLKNTGKNGDMTTAGNIEIYFGPYKVDHITRSVTYDAATGLYSFDTAPLLPPFVPVTDTTYLLFKSYNVSIASGSEDGAGAVLRNVTQVGATSVYTFTLDGAETITGTSALSAWTSGGGTTWVWNVPTANAWHHATGNVVPLVAGVWVPTSNVTYRVVVTLSNVTVAGTGLVITAGGMTPAIISSNGAHTMYFTAGSAAALTITPGAGGTWVGDISAVNVTIHDQNVNKMLQNNIASRKVDFYKYSVPTLSDAAPIVGVVLSKGETYVEDMTHNLILYYRGAVDQTLLIQQLA